MSTRGQAIAEYHLSRIARFDELSVLTEDFDEFDPFNEEQIVNNYAIDLEEEARIKEAGHVW